MAYIYVNMQCLHWCLDPCSSRTTPYPTSPRFFWRHYPPPTANRIISEGWISYSSGDWESWRGMIFVANVILNIRNHRRSPALQVLQMFRPSCLLVERQEIQKEWCFLTEICLLMLLVHLTPRISLWPQEFQLASNLNLLMSISRTFHLLTLLRE